ncbi:DNA/RNA polymerase [Cristinia sonorae]|uniref:DNA polymerase eta n=1 Tax=Cristinia sonorae TaxID=1940300 RepID=A0A8K0UPP0_9AGAR|nr:DNA/RNA polymerase [Cristinia sonorae]
MATTSPRKSASALWKGKTKSTLQDYEDLNPTITYRHLHSHNLGVKDPLRVIALCDSDAFYAACEQVRLGIDPSVPLVVQQWDSLIAVNYPARKFGISRMDRAKEAKKRCPELMLVHVATFKEGEKEPGYWENPDSLTHKVSLDHYRRESTKIIQMFKEGLPEGEIERASIDEAFIDFTRPVRDEILKRYPHLAQVPDNAPNGKDSPLPPPPTQILWNEKTTIVPISLPPPDCAAEGSGIAETKVVQETDEGEPCTWHDVALSIAAELMAKIRDDIYSKLGYTTSAGIARNKFIAKLAASYRKPNSQSVVRNAAIPNYLRPMAFQKIRYLGGKLGKAIAEEYDVSTVGDLLTITLEEMQHKFGEESIWVYEILRGIDRSEVKEKPSVTKSMLASKNLPQPIVQTSQGHHWIRVLAAELALRLKEAREAVPALWPKSIVLHIRQGYETSRSKQAPFPFSREITVDLVASAGDKLWKDLVGAEGSRKTPFKITNVQLSFSGIESMAPGQRSIEGFFKDSHGVGPSTPSKSKRKREDSDDESTVPRNADSPRASSARGDSADTTALVASSSLYSFVCTQCHKRLTLPGGVTELEDEEIKNEAMITLRQEHDDWHFAQELSRQSSSDQPRLAIRPPSHPSKLANVNERFATGGKKRLKEKAKPDMSDKGIAKFFSKP